MNVSLRLSRIRLASVALHKPGISALGRWPSMTTLSSPRAVALALQPLPLRAVADHQKREARIRLQQLGRIQNRVEPVRHSMRADISADELAFEPELALDRRAVVAARKAPEIGAVHEHRDLAGIAASCGDMRHKDRVTETIASACR